MVLFAIILSSVIGFLIIALFIFALISDKMFFGRRYDKNPAVKFFTAEHFGLDAEPIEVGLLKGYIYSKSHKDDKLVIFSHGMGAGHLAYTTEIAYLCRAGFTVIALDSIGCNLSKGKSIKGMYSGVETVVSAIDYAKNSERFKNSAIYLVGHSWGGYSVLCATAKRKVEGVVSISAPVTPAKTMCEGASNIIPHPLAVILKPFWALVFFLKYGAKGNANACKCLKKSNTSALLIHGGKDKIVRLCASAYAKAEGQSITKHFEEEKGHNPYNTVCAEAKLAELQALLARKGDLSSFDFVCATEEDEKVMQIIASFIGTH